LKEEMAFLEADLELDEIGEWRYDVEALERFALTCRAARVLTLDSSLWRCAFLVPFRAFFSVILIVSSSTDLFVTEPTLLLTKSRAKKMLLSSYDSMEETGGGSSSSSASSPSSPPFDPTMLTFLRFQSSTPLRRNGHFRRYVLAPW
jgi:hypothetical protein